MLQVRKKEGAAPALLKTQINGMGILEGWRDEGDLRVCGTV